MRRLIQLLLICCASVAGYGLLFGFVVSRPLVVDEVAAILRVKLDYASEVASPKIVIIAGSNARVSHSCAVIGERLQRPCANLGLTAEVGLDWVLDAARAHIHRGDIVYLPIELATYSGTRTEMLTGFDAAYRWRHDKASLLARGPDGMLRAMFMFDIRTLVDSVGEMALAARGFRRRVGVTTLNAQGDEVGHTDEAAKAYESFLRTLVYVYPEADHLLDNPEGGEQAALAAFLDWCRDNGVTAVGGLPTTTDEKRHSEALVETLRGFYARHGAEFIALENRSQYPREMFFDTPMHLRQGAQMAHSELVAEALRPLVK